VFIVNATAVYGFGYLLTKGLNVSPPSVARSHATEVRVNVRVNEHVFWGASLALLGLRHLTRKRTNVLQIMALF